MSLFWENLENARIMARKERKDIEKECQLANNAFTQGIKIKSSPSVDLAYKLAKAVGITIEELVAGESGAEFVRKAVRNDPGAIQVPERIYHIVESLLLIDEDQLTGIRANVEALALRKKGKPEEAPGLERQKKKTG